MPNEEDDDEIQEAPPGWLTVEEVAEKIFLDLLSQSTARYFISDLARRDPTQDDVLAALIALIYQVQEQVDDPSKDLISFILSAMPGVAAAFAEGDDRYPLSAELQFRRYLGPSSRFMLGAPREWLEPMAADINERLERLARGEEP